ncbi:hypothetical protein ACU4GR_18835 [Methylobacterium oryzae CBMB20]
MPIAKRARGFSPAANHSISSARVVSGVVSLLSRAMRCLPVRLTCAWERRAGLLRRIHPVHTRSRERDPADTRPRPR